MERDIVINNNAANIEIFTRPFRWNWTKIHRRTERNRRESFVEMRAFTLGSAATFVPFLLTWPKTQCGGVVCRGVFEASYWRCGGRGRGGRSFVPLPSGEKIGLDIGLFFDRFSIIFR